MKLIAGSSHPSFSKKISEILNIPIASHLNSRFADGEIRIEIHENIKNESVLLIQSLGPPVNENIMELFVLLDALKQAQARSITVVIPYLGYARQDRKTTEGSPVSAQLMARFFKQAGANQAILLDLHSEAVEKFFDIPVQHISAFVWLSDQWKKQNSHITDLTCVSPDQGGLKRARDFASRIGANLACIHKKRSQPNQAQAMKLEGKVGKNALIVDDMIDTAGTLCAAIDNLIQNGAENIFVVSVHGIFSPPAVQRIEQSPVKEIWVTDSVVLNASAQSCKKIKVISAADLMAQACKNLKG